MHYTKGLNSEMESPLAHQDKPFSAKVFYPLVSGFLETTLNQLLYKESALKQVRVRLIGKVMAVKLQELSQPLILVFSEKQLDVLNQWCDEIDCTITTTLPVLLKLRDKQQLSYLIGQGDITIEGDMQLVQHWSALLDMAEWDPAHYLSPYVGDIVAQGISQCLGKGAKLFSGIMSRQKEYLAQAVTEEWKMAPSALEVAYFCDEIQVTENSLTLLEKRLRDLEKNKERAQ